MLRRPDRLTAFLRPEFLLSCLTTTAEPSTCKERLLLSIKEQRAMILLGLVRSAVIPEALYNFPTPTPN